MLFPCAGSSRSRSGWRCRPSRRPWARLRPARLGWALDEQCLQYDECGRYRPFVDAGKTVFILEYRGPASAVCGREPRGTSVSLKRLGLDARVTRCPFRPAG